MKASRLVVLALFLAFLLGTVPSSVAWDGRVVPVIATPDTDDPKPITEGDPWDDNDDGGPDGTNIGSGVIISQFGLPGWFTKYRVTIYRVKTLTENLDVRKVEKKKANISK